MMLGIAGIFTAIFPPVLARPVIGSVPIKGIMALFSESLYAVSLPQKLESPLAHYRFTLLHLPSLFGISAQAHLVQVQPIFDLRREIYSFYRCLTLSFCTKVSPNRLMGFRPSILLQNVKSITFTLVFVGLTLKLLVHITIYLLYIFHSSVHSLPVCVLTKCLIRLTTSSAYSCVIYSSLFKQQTRLSTTKLLRRGKITCCAGRRRNILIRPWCFSVCWKTLF